MPTYDYRCKNCGTAFALFYKTYKEYDAAARSCPKCGSADLTRLITRVAIQRPGRDYTRMDSGEMLSVLESGDSRQVGEMFKQIGGDAPGLGADFQEATDRLLKGESIDSVERDMSARESSDGGEA